MSCWQQSNFHSFQAVCVIVALLSWLLMRYTGLNVQVAVEACTSGNTSDQSKFCEVCYLFKVLFNTNREAQSVTVMIFTFNSHPADPILKNNELFVYWFHNFQVINVWGNGISWCVWKSFFWWHHLKFKGTLG